MQTKSIGAILIVLGIVMMAYTGFNYMTTEKVAEIGPIEIQAKKNNPVRWSPIVGVALLLGGVVVLVGSKRTSTT